MAKETQENGLFTYTPTAELLDRQNVAILAALSCDPRLTMAALGRQIGLSPPATTERVRRLEEAGIIKGYRIDIDPVALGLPIAAYVRVRPQPGQLSRIAELARQIPEIVECHRITGDDCFIMKVYLPAMDQLDRLLDRFLLYGTTTTSILQTSSVPLRNPPLPKE